MADDKLEECVKNLASLNEIIAEYAQVLAEHGIGEPEFASLVRDTLRTHSWRLGMEFQGERPNAEFFAEAVNGVTRLLKRQEFARLHPDSALAASEMPQELGGER